MAVNHLGHFMLTCLLLPQLRFVAQARTTSPSSGSGRDNGVCADARFPRVVNVTSVAHIVATHGVDWSQHRNDAAATQYNPYDLYGSSKLANILFTRRLARVALTDDVKLQAVSVHPGVLDTTLWRHVSPLRRPEVTNSVASPAPLAALGRAVVAAIRSIVFLPAAVAAADVLECCLGSHVSDGQYHAGGNRLAACSSVAISDVDADTLWTTSQTIVAAYLDSLRASGKLAALPAAQASAAAAQASAAAALTAVSRQGVKKP